MSIKTQWGEQWGIKRLLKEKPAENQRASTLLAERQGFEPRVPRSTTVFKTAAIDHSATSPKQVY